MILLKATRNGDGSFTFRVSRAGGDSASTTRELDAAQLLFRIGIDDPDRLIQQAKQWRSVENPIRAEVDKQ
jgi:hypothetical protein